MSKFDVLSTHKAKATFAGIQHIPCRFMTSLCPDRCGHAKDVAKFTIDEYEAYEKLGEYGDEKQTDFYADINLNATEDKQDPALIEKIKGLKPGAKVRISWEHIYVDDNGSRYPERPLRTLETL